MRNLKVPLPPAKDLRAHRIQSDNASVTRLIENIRWAINPFGENLERDILFNISSRKTASEETAIFFMYFDGEWSKASR